MCTCAGLFSGVNYVDYRAPALSLLDYRNVSVPLSRCAYRAHRDTAGPRVANIEFDYLRLLTARYP